MRKQLGVPPVLLGYNYSPKEAKDAASKNRLLSIRIETSADCNLRCCYCNGVSGRKLPGEISFKTLKRTISEAGALGAKSVVVIGGGEPTIYPHFKPLIRYIDGLGMIPVIITNATNISPKLAAFLYTHNASVLFKFDSLIERTQDYLAGKNGAYKLIKSGVENLLSAGFNKSKGKQLRCGASFVLTKKNYNEIPAIWRFCRDNNIYPNLEDFIPRNRGLKNIKELALSKNKIRKIKQELLSIDKGIYGYNWLVYTPLPGHGCLQNMYSLYISSKGYIRPCADVDIKLFNIKNMKLSQALKAPFFNFVRNIREHLEGKCYQCEHNDICIGCRGNAFSRGTNEGLDIYKAFCQEDPLCWKN